MPSDTVTPGRAILRHPVVFALIIILCTALGAGAGFVKPPQYSTEARLLVGQLNVSAQAIPGVVNANGALASTYSRLVSTTGFLDVVAAQMKVPTTELPGTLEASPIPQSSIIRLVATAPTAAEARSLGAAAATALTTYVAQINGQSTSVETLLTDYRAASVALAQAQRNLAELRAERATTAAIDAAEAQVAEAQLRVDSLATQYKESETGVAAPAAVTLLQPADIAESDRPRNIQLGIALGLVVGSLLALLVVTRMARRRLRNSRRSAGDHLRIREAGTGTGE